MRISIALATYNGEKYIIEQLESLRLQKRPADEVIIRDDCSTDETYPLCAEYIRKHDLPWKLFRAQKNGGYRENFRACIEKTTGDWVLLCDQDDIWEPEKLDCFEEIAETHSDAAAIACGFCAIDANGAPLTLLDAPGKANHGLIPFSLPDGVSSLEVAPKHPELLLTQNIAMGCCMGFTRAVCDRYLRLTKCRFPHDWELTLGASFAGEIYFVSQPLIRYRLHGKNAIGLPGLVSGGVKGPSREGRLRVMDDFDGLLASAQAILADMDKPPLPARYNEYASLRRAAIEKRSITKWFSLYRYRDIYSRMFTWKQQIGDLLVILMK